MTLFLLLMNLLAALLAIQLFQVSRPSLSRSNPKLTPFLLLLLRETSRKTDRRRSSSTRSTTLSSGCIRSSARRIGRILSTQQCVRVVSREWKEGYELNDVPPSRLVSLQLEAEFPFHQGVIAGIFFCGWLMFSNCSCFFSSIPSLTSDRTPKPTFPLLSTRPVILLQLFIAVIQENFSVAEELKKKQQIEAFIKKTQPKSSHSSWLDRWNPYRLLKGKPKAIAVQNLPPNLVLPLKKSIVRDFADAGASVSSSESILGQEN